MSALVMMNSRSMKLTLETQIIKVRIMTPITKIETRTMLIKIPAIALAIEHLDTISTTTAMEVTPTTPRATSRISPLICK